MLYSMYILMWAHLGGGLSLEPKSPRLSTAQVLGYLLSLFDPHTNKTSSVCYSLHPAGVLMLWLIGVLLRSQSSRTQLFPLSKKKRKRLSEDSVVFKHR